MLLVKDNNRIGAGMKVIKRDSREDKWSDDKLIRAINFLQQRMLVK